MPGEAWIERATNIYRRLLRLYSPEFRQVYGGEMVRLFHARLERASLEGRWQLAVSLVLGLWDLGASAFLDRLSRVSHRAIRARLRSGDSLLRRSLRNVRFAIRSLLRQPALVVTVVLTLALGTGATLAFFTIADTALLRPLPYPDADRLVAVVQSDPRFGFVPFAPPYLEDLRERTKSFDAIAGFSSSWSMRFVGTGEPRNIVSAFVSDGLLELVGAGLLEGRTFVENEYDSGAPRVALVTRSFWNRHFGLAASFSEKTIRLDESPYAIVGILPSTLRLPITTSAVSRRDDPAEVFVPFSANPYAEVRSIPVMNVIGRLGAGVDLERAKADLRAVGKALAQDFPETSRLEVTGVILGDLVTRNSRRTVWTLLAAAGFLLLIACANVASLLLARAAERRSEMAVRVSLGARRSQLLRQLFTESLVLATAGSVSGLLLARWLLESVPALGLTGLPPSAVVKVDAGVSGAAIVLAVVTSLLFGLAPAWYTAHDAAAGVLRSARASKSGAGARSVLVATEIALAFFLLVGAGLLARSFWNLLEVDPGFRAEGLLQVPLDLTSDTYDSAERRVFVDEVVRRLEGLPQVTSVGAVNRLPLSGSNVWVGVDVEGLDPTDGAQSVVVDRRVITPGYLTTMGMLLLEGRDLSANDRVEAMPVAIANETLARRFWPEGALGQRVRLQLRSGPGPWLTVVGVCSDVRHHGLDAPAEPELYVPYSQAPVESMVAVARSSSDPLALARRAREQVWALDKAMPLDGLGPVSGLVEQSVVEPRLRMLVLNGFGALALLLAAVGVYGVTTYSVTCKTREIGLRMALGARARSVLGQFVGRGMVVTLWGVGAGAGAAALLSRFLEGLLFGVTPTDLTTFVGVALLLIGVSVVASYVPARRASVIDPIRTLRSE